MDPCSHVDQIRDVKPKSVGCADCLALGDTWVHLRMCRTCGYVGCCDESKNKHASKHYSQTNHPLVKSIEPGEEWSYCYVDRILLLLDEEPLGPRRVDQSTGVVRTYLVFVALYTLSASFIWGVNTLFLLDAGLDIFGVFVANSVFTASMAVFEIPTGVLADTRGRRISLLFSLIIMLMGTVGYVAVSWAGGGLFLFSVMSVVLGLGYTFYSGAGEAWLVDALGATGFEGELDHVFARSSMVTGVAMLVGTVSGGLMGSLDLAVPYLVRVGFLAAVLGIIYFFVHDVGFRPRAADLASMPREMRKIAQASIAFGWRRAPVRLLVLTSLVQSAFLMWGWYAWQPYFLDLLGRDLTWVAGVIAALISLATIAGNSLVEWFSRYCGKRTTLLIWAAAIHAVAAMGVGLVNSFWLAVALYLVVMATLGVWQPVKQAFIHQLIPSEQRATVISFDSLMGSLGGVMGQTGLGRLSQTSSIASGYIVGGAVTVLVVPAAFLLRRRNEAADVIVGKAGKRGSCAAQGVPSVSTVDSTA